MDGLQEQRTELPKSEEVRRAALVEAIDMAKNGSRVRLGALMSSIGKKEGVWQQAPDTLLGALNIFYYLLLVQPQESTLVSHAEALVMQQCDLFVEAKKEGKRDDIGVEEVNAFSAHDAVAAVLAVENEESLAAQRL